jgi:hypothetical protein
MTLNQIVTALGQVKLDEYPTWRAARTACEFLEEMKRLTEDVAPHGRCDACGHPNKPDGTCSRRGCRNDE